MARKKAVLTFGELICTQFLVLKAAGESLPYRELHERTLDMLKDSHTATVRKKLHKDGRQSDVYYRGRHTLRPLVRAGLVERVDGKWRLTQSGLGRDEVNQRDVRRASDKNTPLPPVQSDAISPSASSKGSKALKPPKSSKRRKSRKAAEASATQKAGSKVSGAASWRSASVGTIVHTIKIRLARVVSWSRLRAN